MTKKSKAADALIAATDRLNPPVQPSEPPTRYATESLHQNEVPVSPKRKQPAPKKVEDNSRNVRTTFYSDLKGKNVVRSTHAKYADNAVPNAIKHMQANHYDAVLAEVYDETGGCVLHAVIKRDIGKHEIRIIYKREE